MSFRSVAKSVSTELKFDTSSADVAFRVQFMLSRSGDIVISPKDYFMTEDTLNDVAVRVKSAFPGSQITGVDEQLIYIDWDDALIECYRFSDQGAVRFYICARPDEVQSIKARITDLYPNSAWSSLKLWYMKEKGATWERIVVKDFGNPVPEFYPWLESGYFDRYLKSSSSVLFMAGPPGTGKTSVLRHMLTSRHLYAVATYDEDVLASDRMFMDFLTESQDSVMVIEDADNFLTSRTEQHNKLIARFLNFSDGLAKMPEKKIIFSTNLGSFDQVDPALTRPGRCFGILHARPLTYKEAVAAAKVANLDQSNIRDGMTIAELLNQDDGDKVELRRVGFATR